MKNLTMGCAFVLALTGPALAEMEEKTPGRELSELIYGSMQEDPLGAIDIGEFVKFGNDIFVSMDSNDNGAIDFGEFTEWDFGFNFIAKDEGQRHAYEAAQKILFSFWDHNSNGEITKSEYHKSMVSDFGRADIDDDAFLTRDEFLNGYVINVAYRAAIIGQ